MLLNAAWEQWFHALNLYRYVRFLHMRPTMDIHFISAAKDFQQYM